MSPKKVISAVKVVLLNRKNQVLLLKQEVNGKTFWDFVGGRVDYGENPYRTLEREVFEEVGLKISADDCDSFGMCYYFREKDQNQVVCSVFYMSVDNPKIDIGHNPVHEPIREFKWVDICSDVIGNYTLSNPSFNEIIDKLKEKLDCTK